MITINGNSIQKKELILHFYLSEHHYEKDKIAIERNGFIVPKRDYEETVLKDGDIVEIVQFVGGG